MIATSQIPARQGPWKVKSTPWAAGLRVSGDGVRVVAHAGGTAVRLLADHVGLTSELSGALTAHPRPGNAGSNTAADHIEVLTAAVAQGPRRIAIGCWCGSMGRPEGYEVGRTRWIDRAAARGRRPTGLGQLTALLIPDVAGWSAGQLATACRSAHSDTSIRGRWVERAGS
jgi:hypothetical protein